MRLFEWNHETGRYGAECVGNSKSLGSPQPLAGWTGQSLEYAVSEGRVAPIPYATPAGFSGNANVTIHIDAGRTTAEGDISYQHATEWRCFCLGEMVAGEDSVWEWVILPPTSLVKPTGPADEDIAYDPQPGDDEPLVHSVNKSRDLTALVLMGQDVVEDFLPNIGNCALQDYGRLNEFMIAATTLRKEVGA